MNQNSAKLATLPNQRLLHTIYYLISRATYAKIEINHYSFSDPFQNQDFLNQGDCASCSDILASIVILSSIH